MSTPAFNVMADDAQYDYQFMSADDRTEISDNKTAILNDLNSVLESEGINEQLDDIPLDAYVKIYIDTNIFALDSFDYQSINSAFDTDSYVYTCTSYLDNVKLEYTLGVVEDISDDEKNALTSEELEDFTEKMGKWCVSSVSVIPEEENSLTELVEQNSFDKYENVILVGSLPGLRYPVAVGFSEGVADDIITLQASAAYEVLEYLPVTESVNSVENVYDFLTVSEIAQEKYASDYEGDNSLIGGGGYVSERQTAWNSIFIPVLLAVAIVGVFIIIRKNINNRK